MNINKVYEKAYTNFLKMNWVSPDPFGLNWFLTGHLNSKFDASFQKDLEATHKRLFPRRKKIKTLDIPEEDITPIKEKYLKKATNYVAAKRKQYHLLDNWLYAHAREVTLEADEQIIYTSDFSTYSSQGYGMERYAESSCERIANILTERGIDNRVTPVYYDESYNLVTDVPRGKKLAYRHSTSTIEVAERERNLYPFGYCVVAPLTKYMLDAILRTTKQTDLEWAISCWKTGTNPKVMNPFLSDDIYEQSSNLWSK